MNSKVAIGSGALTIVFCYRFSLLLLEPGEIYFEDFSVFYYQGTLSQQDANIRKQRGHLKMCSKSIVFVPKDILFPIIKFPLKFVTEIEGWSGRLYSKFGNKDKILKIISDQAIEMKEKNITAPFIFRKGSMEHRFALNYAALEDCLPLFCQLQRASTLPSADQTHMINAIVLSRQSRVKFNTSWLEDLYENIVLETQCDRITPLAKNPGRILLTSSRLYFQPLNNIDKWPVLKIRLKDIRRLILRRFLLRQLGLELYCEQGAPISHLYLAFKSEQCRTQLYDEMVKQPDLKLDDTKQEDMTLRWQSGFISNYEYILYLNSLADRSFNDLTQYPVMPWIFSDYSSNQLDLEDPSVYRDLRKPIGALNEERLARIRERFEDMAEPRFMYGSHYSTPGYVLFFLARICPEYVLCLQNGKFDHADRMFNSLQDTWNNCLQGAADFKELIPEFYTGSSEFLVHKGIINFGIKQDGHPVGDVELPPWAEGPSDFMKKLQEGLESEFVSRKIHHWIDLIFGFQQRGIEAEKADNLFYYLTYEGAVDLDSIDDPNERAGLETQIMEFGQVPKQLFTNPHPKRLSSKGIPRQLPAATKEETDELSSVATDSAQHTGECNSESSLFSQTTGTMVLIASYVSVAECCMEEHQQEAGISSNLSKIQVRFQYTLHKEAVSDVKLSADGRNTFSVSLDSMMKMFSLEEQRQLRSVNMSSMTLSTCVVLPDNKTVVIGSWDNNVYFYSIEYGRVLHALQGHDDAVSHLAWRNDVLYTASWDSSIKIWQMMQIGTGQTFTVPEYHAQLDHDEGVTCVSVDCSSQVLVSGGKGGQLCVWDLPSYSLRSQLAVHHGRINSLLISADLYRILSCGADNYIKVIDISTGSEIFTKDVQDEILCMQWAGPMVAAGNSAGYLQVWDMDKGQLLQQQRAHSDAVTSIDVGEEGCLVSGGQDKTVTVWHCQS